MENMHALKMHVFLAYMCIILIYPSQSFDTWDLVLSLNSDGSLKSSSKTPNCGRDSVIDLISYKYLQKQCHYSDGCHTAHEESLSPAAEVLIHKMCSWKEECNNFSFPLTSMEQTTKTNAINLKFRCVDHVTKRINICATGDTYFNNAVYLTSYDNATLHEECYCFVDKGNVSVTISDLRLVCTNDNQRSPAVLLINNKEFACGAKREGFGSVFHRQIIRSATNAYISWKLNSRTISPDMILLTLTPEVSAKITCSVKEPKSGLTPAWGKQSSTTQSMWPFTSNVSSTTQSSPITSSSTSYTDQTTESTTHNECETKAPLSTLEMCLIAFIVIMGLAFYLRKPLNGAFHRLLNMCRQWLLNMCRQQAQSHDTSQQGSPKDFPKEELDLEPIKPQQTSDMFGNPVTSPSNPSTSCDLSAIGVSMRPDASHEQNANRLPNECEETAIPEYKSNNFHFVMENTHETASLLGIQKTDNEV